MCVNVIGPDVVFVCACMSRMNTDAGSSIPNSLFISQTRQDPVTITQVLPTHKYIHIYNKTHGYLYHRPRQTFQTDVNRP